MLKQINVYIGYDPSEGIAAQVLAHSITSRSSIPVNITFLMLNQLRQIHKRERHELQSTDFSFTRFLVPYLSQYRGYNVFMDCDMLMLDDIANLDAHCRGTVYPVKVVKHDYKPTNTTKMLGQKQTQYPCKNWSSFMVFWSAHADCGTLTPEIVDNESGLYLHQFKWTDRVGELDARWNHLIGYDKEKPIDDISVLHWTEGGPWWEKYKNTRYADVWFEEKAKMEQAYERPKVVAK